MTTTLTAKKERLHYYIDLLDEYQTDLFLSFLVTLLDSDD